MLRWVHAPVLCLSFACGPADPGAGIGTTDVTTGTATLGASTTGTPTTADASPTAALPTTVDEMTDTTASDTTTDATTVAPTTTEPITGTSTTDVDATTGTTGAPLDVCDDPPFPDLPQHACDEFITVETCTAGGCVWVTPAARWAAVDCACAEQEPAGVCVFTPDQSWGGGQAPSAMFRVVDGAVEVIEIGHVVAEVPGWKNCDDVGSPALCDCACPDVIHCWF